MSDGVPLSFVIARLVPVYPIAVWQGRASIGMAEATLPLVTARPAMTKSLVNASPDPAAERYRHASIRGAPMSIASAATQLLENRLARETSPYLLQHKHNPVDWWPWGPPALAEAERAGNPILLSVGYAACHWCHVMAHESFEDADVAAVMNDLFVNIKVDREERPDIDQIYMSALHMLGEQGGWPLTM